MSHLLSNLNCYWVQRPCLARTRKWVSHAGRDGWARSVQQWFNTKQSRVGWSQDKGSSPELQKREQHLAPCEASWWLLDKEHSSNRQELICMAGHLAQLVRAAWGRHLEETLGVLCRPSHWAHYPRLERVKTRQAVASNRAETNVANQPCRSEATKD